MGELLAGMRFNSYKDLCEFSGIKFDVHKSYLISKINQICKIHTEDKEIVIDEVFGKISDIKYNNKQYLYSVGDVVKTKSGSIKIIKQIRVHKRLVKGYRYMCMLDGYIGEIAESHITKGVGCPVCGNAKCVDGINSIYDTRKDLLKFFANEDDSHRYTACSGKKILCKCPICGYEKIMSINNLSRHGLSCNFCSDGLSYPNKFVYCFLNQLKINFVSEHTFSWCTNKVYDIYIPSLNMIIENHGKQHYVKSGFEISGGRTLKEEQENDSFKYNVAIKNGIQYYITIDCRKSDLEYIKNSIMSSYLPSLLNFSDKTVDWNLCHKYALNPIIEDVCKYWENNNKNITCTKEHFKLDIHTVMQYLEKGAKIGYCSYKKGFMNSKILSSTQFGSKPIYNVENDIYFFSKKECEQYFKDKYKDSTFSGYVLYKYINNSKKYHNNTFIYVDKKKYNEQKALYDNDDSPQAVIGDYYLERYIK